MWPYIESSEGGLEQGNFRKQFSDLHYRPTEWEPVCFVSLCWAARFGTHKWILTSRVWKPLFLLLDSIGVTPLQTWSLSLMSPSLQHSGVIFSLRGQVKWLTLSPHLQERPRGHSCLPESFQAGAFFSKLSGCQLSSELTVVSTFLPTLLNSANKKLLGSMFIKVCIENHSLAGTALRRECNLPTVRMIKQTSK